MYGVINTVAYIDLTPGVQYVLDGEIYLVNADGTAATTGITRNRHVHPDRATDPAEPTDLAKPTTRGKCELAATGTDVGTRARSFGAAQRAAAHG